MTSPQLDRLVILTVSGAQVDALFAHLAREKFTFTMINSAGGMLQEAEVCLMVGFHSERLQVLLDIVRKNCHPYRQFVSTRGFMPGEMAGLPMLEAELGGAWFYMMNVEQFEQF
jgi:uncharacterized protein YaaQ